MKRTLVTSLTLLLLCATAHAQGDPAFSGGQEGYSPAATAMDMPSSRGTTTIGLLLGPTFGVVDAGGTIFKLGPEIATKYFQMPLLFGFGSGLDLLLEVIPKFKYDIEVIPNLLITPSVGLDLWFGFSGGSAMWMGIELAGRATYFVTPQLGLFFEPLALDMHFFGLIFDSGASASGFAMFYRLAAGAVYAF